MADWYVFPPQPADRTKFRRPPFWVEAKRPVGGVASTEQLWFQRRNADCGIAVVIGSLEAVKEHTRRIGLWRPPS